MTASITINRYQFECRRTWDFLEKLPADSPIWDTTLEKAYRLTVLAEGGTEAEAQADAVKRMGTWRALNAAPYRVMDWRTA